MTKQSAMNRQNKDQKQNQIARLGIAGLAVGLLFAGMRARRKAQARHWQAHLNRPVVRKALVTGASAGIGQAYADRLARNGLSARAGCPAYRAAGSTGGEI